MRKSMLPFAAAILLVAHLGHATVASAQDPMSTWRSIGPAGAYVKALVIDPATPATLYAGMVTDDSHPVWGVQKSIDGGNTWSDSSVGLPQGLNIWTLAIDPVTPSTLYAGLDGSGYSFGFGGLFKSIDGGATWNDATSGGLPQGTGVLSFAIDPTNPLTLYAGMDGGGGVFKSMDGGATWNDANTDVTRTLSFFSLAADPVTSGTLYAGAYVGGVFKTTDGGSTWNAVNNGLPTNLIYFALTIDPMTPSTLYAGTGDWTNDTGSVLKSLDGGATWNDITSTLPTAYSIHAIAINPQTTSTVYVASYNGGAFISADGGNTWSDFNAGLADPAVHGIAINPQAPSTIYVGTCNSGVFVLAPSS